MGSGGTTSSRETTGSGETTGSERVAVRAQTSAAARGRSGEQWPVATVSARLNQVWVAGVAGTAALHGETGGSGGRGRTRRGTGGNMGGNMGGSRDDGQKRNGSECTGQQWHRWQAVATMRTKRSGWNWIRVAGRKCSSTQRDWWWW